MQRLSLGHVASHELGQKALPNGRLESGIRTSKQKPITGVVIRAFARPEA